MKWVTRDHVHMDRVGSPWLIRRFIDPEAQFVFIPIAKTLGEALEPDVVLPEDAIPFALPGVELGPHDAQGSTFRKILVKYGLEDPVLELMARIIESGVVHIFHHHEPGYSVANLEFPEGVGLDALAIGMMYFSANDMDNLDRSLVMYDALYDYCAGKLLLKERPELAGLQIPARWDEIKRSLDRTRPRRGR
jgi:hypothetical protein